MNKNQIAKNSIFTPTGSLSSVMQFDWSDSTGSYEEYWPNGNIRKSGSFRFLLNYIYLEYYKENDSANSAAPAERGMFNSPPPYAPFGEWSTYYEDATLKSRGNFLLVDHKYTDEDGFIQIYLDPDDPTWIFEDFKFYDVIKDGVWKYYYPSGKEKQTVVLNKGNIVR